MRTHSTPSRRYRPRKRAGAVSQRSSTPSSRASSSSSAGTRASQPRCAGRGASRARRPRRTASRATSIAVFPPPMTATLRPIFGVRPVLSASMNGSELQTPSRFVAQEPGRRVGAHPDGEDDRVVRRGDRDQLRAVDPSAEDDARAEPLRRALPPPAADGRAGGRARSRSGRGRPARCRSSNTVTPWPRAASSPAQASPAGPAPTTATGRPVGGSRLRRGRPSASAASAA